MDSPNRILRNRHCLLERNNSDLAIQGFKLGKEPAASPARREAEYVEHGIKPPIVLASHRNH